MDQLYRSLGRRQREMATRCLSPRTPTSAHGGNAVGAAARSVTDDWAAWWRSGSRAVRTIDRIGSASQAWLHWRRTFRSRHVTAPAPVHSRAGEAFPAAEPGQVGGARRSTSFLYQRPVMTLELHILEAGRSSLTPSSTSAARTPRQWHRVDTEVSRDLLERDTRPALTSNRTTSSRKSSVTASAQLPSWRRRSQRALLIEGGPGLSHDGLLRDDRLFRAFGRCVRDAFGPFVGSCRSGVRWRRQSARCRGVPRSEFRGP
jgi:hypothetical protein